MHLFRRVRVSYRRRLYEAVARDLGVLLVSFVLHDPTASKSYRGFSRRPIKFQALANGGASRVIANAFGLHGFSFRVALPSCAQFLAQFLCISRLSHPKYVCKELFEIPISAAARRYCFVSSCFQALTIFTF